MSLAGYDARRQWPSVSCNSRYKDVVMSKGCSNGVMPETMEMRRRVKQLQNKTGNLAGRVLSRKKARGNR